MQRMLVLCLIATVTGVCGCKPSSESRVVGSGTLTTATPAVEAFDEVRFVGAFRVQVTVGGAPSVSITTDDNIMPFVVTNVENGALTVRLTEKVKPSDANIVKITTGSLSRLSVVGAASARINDVAGPSFTLTVEGAGSVTITGIVDALTLEVDGAGSIDALGLEAKSVDVSLNGAGSVETHAVEKLNVSLAGIGSVHYKGDPQITKSISGLGSVKKK